MMPNTSIQLAALRAAAYTYWLVTRTISLDETEEAFAAIERSETLRTVIRLPDA